MRGADASLQVTIKTNPWQCCTSAVSSTDGVVNAIVVELCKRLSITPLFWRLYYNRVSKGVRKGQDGHASHAVCRASIFNRL